MAKFFGWIGAAVVLAAGVAAIWIYQTVAEIDVDRITDDVHMLSGLGSNVGVLRTSDGAVIVDSMTFRMQGEAIREKAEELADGPTQALINTHYHADHTHGNPAFPVGMRIVSTARTLDYLQFFDAEYWDGDSGGTVPNETFTSNHELRVGGKTIRLHHVGRGHTGGDLVVVFVEDRVLHTGDLFFNRRYPNIDLEAGGSVREWSATLDRVLALEFDKVIPGHGPPSDREGLLGFQRFIRQLWQVGERAAREGKSLEDTLATADLTADEGYEAMEVPFILLLDRDFVIRRAWEEATGAAAPLDVPAVAPPTVGSEAS